MNPQLNLEQVNINNETIMLFLQHKIFQKLEGNIFNCHKFGLSY